VLDRAKAKALLFQWLQQTQRGTRPSDSVSLENCDPSRKRDSSRLYRCNCWVWTPDGSGDGWTCFAGEPQTSRKDAAPEAFAAAVNGLQIPVTKEFALTAEGLRRLEARKNLGAVEEQRRRLQAEQCAAAVANAVEALQPKALASLFPDIKSDQSGFYTPREKESEPMPEPLPPPFDLPMPAEADRQDLQMSSQKGGKAAQTLQRIVSKESAGMLQGPMFIDADPFNAPGGKKFLCVCGLVFDGSVAIVGTGLGPKKNAARSTAARAALARLDIAPALPSADEAGEHAAVMVDMRKLHAMHPFRVWVLQGIRPGAPEQDAKWQCALWGRVPHNGHLREFWGEGFSHLGTPQAIAGACAMAAGQLTSMLGSSDVASWLKAMARVPMEVEEVPTDIVQDVLELREDGDGGKDAALHALERLAAQTQKGAGAAWKPPDLSRGPAETAPQTYELPAEGDAVEAQRLKRGVPLLPVRELREELAQNLEDEAVIVVSGGTGSGKSTQIPHYILSDFRPEGDAEWQGQASTARGANGPKAWVGPPRVVVTEPRRIATVSLAERVAWERGEAVGETVGYSVRGDTRRPRARQKGTVEFCTVGILLRRLQKDPGLQEFSHVLIDEVHERDLMTDFLLILLKELLVWRTDLRIVLMSATIDVASFSSYFWDCPCVEVPTGPRFTVEEIHLEDHQFGSFSQTRRLLEKEAQARDELARSEEGIVGDADMTPDTAPDMEDEFAHKTGVWWGDDEKDDTLWELMALLICKIAQTEVLTDDQGIPGSVLCFLPGWAEIKLVQDLLEDRGRGNSRLWVLPLHSSLTKEDQQLIFSRPPEGKTKVILATNIAESSVTIDDVLVVVDSGLAREVSYDAVRHLSQLETVWVSQSSAIQRAGRAGRVRTGKCYRLYSRAQQEAVPWRSAPEMQRCELSSTCLQALALCRECREFLNRAVDPPARSAVESAVQELIDLGAIFVPGPSAELPSDGLLERMLPLGEKLSRMPLSPAIGRMLIMGVLFKGVGIACLIAAVITATRRPFVAPPGKRKESLACQCSFDATSDVFAAVYAVRYYESRRRAKGDRYADREASEMFLIPKRLTALLAARDGMRDELVRAGVLAGGRGWHGRSSTTYSREMWRDWYDDRAGEWSGGYEGGGDGLRNEPADMNSNDSDPELAKALLVAAFPSFLALRRRFTSVKHNTRIGLEAIVSPQSVNAPAKTSKQAPNLSREEANTPTWWAYGQMQIDTQKQGFLRQVTLIDPYHIALFGGFSSAVDASGALKEVDGWIELRGGRKTREVLGVLRAEIRRCVHTAALGSGTPLPDRSREALDAAMEVLRLAGPRAEQVARLLPERSSRPRLAEGTPTSGQWGGRQAGWD